MTARRGNANSLETRCRGYLTPSAEFDALPDIIRGGQLSRFPQGSPPMSFDTIRRWLARPVGHALHQLET